MNASRPLFSLTVLLAVSGCHGGDGAPPAGTRRPAREATRERKGTGQPATSPVHADNAENQQPRDQHSPDLPRTAQSLDRTERSGPTQARQQSNQDKLVGTWTAQDVDTSIGEVKIKLAFRQQGQMKLAALSDIPLVGQVRDQTAPYEATESTISSDAIRGGTTVEYWFDGADLIVRYKEGKTVRFTRQEGAAARGGPARG